MPTLRDATFDRVREGVTSVAEALEARDRVMHSTSSDLRFAWRGVAADGAKKRGWLIAVDASAERIALRHEGVLVLELDALGHAPPPKASARDVTVFTRQLAGLLRAGLPLAAVRWLKRSPEARERADRALLKLRSPVRCCAHSPSRDGAARSARRCRTRSNR